MPPWVIVIIAVVALLVCFLAVVAFGVWMQHRERMMRMEIQREVSRPRRTMFGEVPAVMHTDREG